MASSAWRHWGCTTPKVITGMKAMFNEASELDGYEDLTPEDQEKVNQAWIDGKVADEDIPETARKPGGAAGEDDEEEEKPKKKRAAPKKKAEDANGDEEEKPKKKAAPKKKAEKDEENDADEEKPKKRVIKAKVRSSMYTIQLSNIECLDRRPMRMRMMPPMPMKTQRRNQRNGRPKPRFVPSSITPFIHGN